MGRLYDTAAWRRARARALHAGGWRCARCGADLVGLGRAVQVHHRKALKRAPALALEPLNLLPLCVVCHKIIEEDEKHKGVARGCDVDGAPLDTGHPWAARGAGSK